MRCISNRVCLRASMARNAAKTDGARRTVEQVRQLLAAHAPEAVAFLVAIMRDEAQKPELRMKAAESVLDRACGKATSATPAEQGPTPPTTVLFEGVLEEWSR